jgi:hypothetical protein
MMIRVSRLTLPLLLRALGFSAAACGRQGATAPDVMPSLMLASPPLAALSTLARKGRFTITAEGDQIVGDYTAAVSAEAAGRETFSLEMTVSGGSGAFAFAAGTLVGEGKGTSTSIGSFSLKITGTMTFPLTPGTSTNIKMTSHGTTSCEDEDHVLLMSGEGSLPTYGRAVVEFRPDSVSALCP